MSERPGPRQREFRTPANRAARSSPEGHRFPKANSHESAAIARAEAARDDVPYSVYADMRAGRDPYPFKSWWKGLSRARQAAYGILAGALTVAGSYGTLEGVSALGKWQTRDSHSNTVPINPNSIPGHDSVATTSTLPSTSPGTPGPR